MTIGWKRFGRTLVPAVLALAITAPASTAGIHWAKSYNAARAQSRRTRKPMLVEFYADWCGPCRMMEETTFQDKEVIKLSARFIPVRVNVDKNRPLARKYSALSIPYAVVLSPSGKTMASALGYHNPAQFSRFMQRGLEK